MREATLPPRERKPHLARLAVRGLLVGIVSTVAFGAMAAGTSQAAFAADPPPASADSGDNKKSRRAKAKDELMAKALAEILDLAAPLDPADPKYKQKLYKQVLANRVITKLGSGSLSISASDIQGLVSDAFEIHRRSKQTVTGLQGRMSKLDKKIEGLRKQVAQAKTPAERDRAKAKLTTATNSRKALNKLLKEAEHQARPFNRDAYIRNLQRAIWGLEQQVNGKASRETKAKIQTRLEQVRKNLETALEDREEERKRRDDDGDEGGTPAKRVDPKQPPTNPSTTGAKKTVTTPTVPKKTTFRSRLGGRGSRGGGAEAIGEALEQIRAEYTNKEYQKLLDKAVKDPKLRERIVKEYLDMLDNGVVEDLTRPFDGTKKFTKGELHAVGPAAVDLHTKALADKSNADPVYQKARQDCGGYDTCVKDRTRKLRQAITDAEQKAKKSANDPVYRKAREDCGGYETCVKERVKKLRNDITKAEKKAKKSANDPLYKQANKECGGYDTCVKDRLTKLRAKNTPEPKRTVTTKTQTKKTTTTEAQRQAKAKKQYEEASKVCGGYDTCVKDRLQKVRNADAKGKQDSSSKPKKKTKK
jgi:hypothetical protein